MTDREPIIQVFRDLAALSTDPFTRQHYERAAADLGQIPPEAWDWRLARDVLTLARHFRDSERANAQAFHAMREQLADTWQRLQTLEALIRRTQADCGELTTAMTKLRSLEQHFKERMEQARGNMRQVVSQTRGGQQDLNKRFHDVNTKLQRLETIGLEVVEYRGYLEGQIDALGERLSRLERGGESEA